MVCFPVTITAGTTTTTTTIAATASITINYYNDIEKPLNIGFRIVRQPILNIPTGFTYLMEPFDYQTNSSITLRYTGPTLSKTYLLPATYSNTTYNFQTYYNPLNVYHNYTFPGHSTNVDSGSFSSTQRVKKLYLNNILLDTKTESNTSAIGLSPSGLNSIYGPMNLTSGFTLSHFDHIRIDMFEKIIENVITTSTTTTTTTLAPTTTSTTTTTTTAAPTTTTSTTTTTTTQVLCYSYQNQESFVWTGDYKVCEGNVLEAQTVLPGNIICAEFGSVVTTSGVLTQTSLCNP